MASVATEPLQELLERGVSGRDGAVRRRPHGRRRPLPGDRRQPALRGPVPRRPAPARLRRARRPARRRLDPRAPNQDERNPVTLRDQITEIIQTEPVALFMKGTPSFAACGNSQRALTALRAAGAPVTAVDILPDPRFRQELSALSGWPTIPQIFVKGELVGGADIVEELAATRRARAEAQRGARRRVPRGARRARRRARCRLRWSWRVSGTYLESCNCDAICPCRRSTACPAAARRTGSASARFVADRRGPRGRDRPLRPRRRARDSLQRRRGRLALDLDPLPGRARGRRSSTGRWRRSGPAASPVSRSTTSPGRGRRATCSASSRRRSRSTTRRAAAGSA